MSIAEDKTALHRRVGRERDSRGQQGVATRVRGDPVRAHAVELKNAAMAKGVTMKSLWLSLAAMLGVALMVSAQAQDKTPVNAKEPEPPEVAALRQRMGDVERGLHGVRQRLGLIPGKGGTVQDAELTKLYADAETARKAVEAKSQDVLKTDPEGAKLLAEREQLEAQAAQLRTRAGK